MFDSISYWQIIEGRFFNKLKAGRPHPRKYPHTPTGYSHTDKHLRLVMTPIALNCTRQSRVSADGRTDGRYQIHYLPRFAVDNNDRRYTAVYTVFNKK